MTLRFCSFSPVRLWALLLSFALFSPACKPPAPVIGPKGPDGEIPEPPPPPSNEEELAADALAAEAAGAAKEGDEAAARKKRDELIELYPGTAAGAEELLRRARAADAAEDVAKAAELYEKVLYYRPQVQDAAGIRARYAELLLQLNRQEDAIPVLRALLESAESADDRQRLGMLLGEALARVGKAREALEMFVETRAMPTATAAVRQEAERRAMDMVVSGLSFKEAEALWSDVEDRSSWDFILPALGFKLAKIYYHTRDYARSEKMLREVARRFPHHEFGEQARDFLTRLKNRFKVEPNRLGVILPLSGPYQQYGNRSLEAIKMGFAEASNIELIVKDSAGEATAAAKAVEDLVLESHVIGIIGPLFSGEALAASLKAEELSVPIVSLSHRDGLPEIGPWVFRTALTVRAQARALAKVAFEELSINRFALLYPRSRYGTEFVDAFWDEVNARKGEIRAAESYEPDQTTFQEPVRKLVGRYYKNARADYHEALEEIRKQKLPPHRVRSAVEKLDKNLPPIVDFDAIVIPDSGHTIGLVAPAIAVEDIVLTHDPRMLERIRKAMGREDVQPVRLLGASTWNSMQTVDRCDTHCEDAIFVDAYYPNSPEPRVRDFVAAFRDKTGAPPYLSEAQAFDTAKLVKWILTANKPRDRKAFRKGLEKAVGFEGVTGKLRFDEEGDVDRELVTLTIEDDMIVNWEATESESEEPQG